MAETGLELEEKSPKTPIETHLDVPSNNREDYIFLWRYIALALPYGIGQILAAVLQKPVLLIICLLVYIIYGFIFLYLRYSPKHRTIITEKFDGSVIRYFSGIPYNHESLTPPWFIHVLFLVAPVYLTVVLLWHLLLYGGDLSTCGDREQYLEDGRCLVESGTTYVFASFYLPALYSSVSMFDISDSNKVLLEEKEKNLLQRFPKLEKILERAKARKVTMLQKEPKLLVLSILAILLFTFVPLAAKPQTLQKVNNASALVLYWLSLPLGAAGLYIIPHILNGLISRYHICRYHLQDLQASANQELEPLWDMENATAWWSLRQYYIRDYFPLVYGLNSVGTGVTLLFVGLCVLIVVIVVFSPLPGSITFRFILILPFFLVIPLGTIAVLWVLNAATKIREAQLNHLELLKRTQQTFFLTLHSTSKIKNEKWEVQDQSFFKFVEYTHDVMNNYDKYPTIFGIDITPAFINLILTYLGTGLISVITKVST